MTTEKSPRTRFEVPGMDEAASEKARAGEGRSGPLADIAHEASLDEESNIPGTDAAPPVDAAARQGGGKRP